MSIYRIYVLTLYSIHYLIHQFISARLISSSLLSLACRRVTYIRRLCRLSSTPSPAPRPITLKFGRPPHPPTAMSARGCCGALPGKACAAPSVGSNVMRSVRSCLMQTVCSVSMANRGSRAIFTNLTSIVNGMHLIQLNKVIERY